MKLKDLEKANNEYNFDNNVKFIDKRNKYLLLEIGNEIESLKIVNITSTAIYLKIADEDENIMPNALEPFINLANDYNLTLDQLYEITRESIEKECRKHGEFHNK